MTLPGAVRVSMRDAELPGITRAEQIVSMPALQHRHWTEDEVRQLIGDAPGPTPRVRSGLDYQGVISAGSRLGFDYDDVRFV